MASCSQCSKRTRWDYACFYCGKRPLCLKCKCSCHGWEKLHSVSCPRCHGTGAIVAPFSGSDPSCPECDGEGLKEVAR